MTEREHRIDAIQKNAAWLDTHDLDEHRFEAAKRLGLLQGDIQALIRDVGNRDD